MIRITKVKLDKAKKINIEYQVLTKAGQWDDFSFSCSDEALPEFYLSIKKLSPHVLELCELPKTYLDRVVTKGVSFSYSTEGIMGAVIIAAMQLKKSNCPLNLNTPHKPSAVDDDQTPMENQLLTEGCTMALKTVINECIKYIAGYRAQTDLFASLQPAIVAGEIVKVEIDSVLSKVDIGKGK